MADLRLRWRGDCGNEEGPAGRAARLLRGRRPGRDHRREGARAVRRAGLRAQGDRAQQARRDDAGRSAARSSSTRPTRCPRARSWSSPRTASRRSCTTRRRARSLQTIDATCPLVTKVHHEAMRFAARRLRHPAHRPRGPRGGRRHRGRGARPRPARRRPRRRRQRRRCATRTRSSGCRRPRCRSTRRWRPCAGCGSGSRTLQDPPSDDICYATQNRQVAVKQMAPECDLVIVVGSRNSSNSVRLVEVALEHGARRRPTWSTTPTRSTRPGSTGVTTVGVTSGASVPEVLVRDVLACLAEHGYADVQPVVAAEENAAVLAAATSCAATSRPHGVEATTVRHDAGAPGPSRCTDSVRRPRLGPDGCRRRLRPVAAGARPGSRRPVPPGSSVQLQLGRATSASRRPAARPRSAAGALLDRPDLGEPLSTRSRSCILRAVTSTRDSSAPTSAL